MIKSKRHKTNKHAFVGRGEQTRAAACLGNFDPITLGHYGVIERTAKMVDKLIIGVLSDKIKCPLPSVREHVNMLKEVTTSLLNVEIQFSGGLLIDLVCGSYADIVVRGLQVVTGFEYELQVAQVNKVIVPEIDTIFLTINLKYSYLSSSVVKETTECEGGVSGFLHPVIAARIGEKLEERRRLT